MTKRILGITGGAGCGKSTALAYLSEKYNALCLLCDDVARQLQKKGQECYEPMLLLLGDDSFLDEQGEFDRARVAKAIFSDPKLLERLNGIIHPAVKRAVMEKIRSSGTSLVVIESALLFDADYDEMCDEIWYIYASEKTRMERLVKSRGYSEERCHNVFRAQKDEAFFRSRTDFTIDNDSETANWLYTQIDRGLAEHGFLYDSEREQR